VLGVPREALARPAQPGPHDGRRKKKEKEEEEEEKAALMRQKMRWPQSLRLIEDKSFMLLGFAGGCSCPEAVAPCMIWSGCQFSHHNLLDDR
jgi:hypothetical protein